MAARIKFYRRRNERNLINSEDTEEFTIIMNNLFNAINRKFPAEGIRKNSKDFEVSLLLKIYQCLCTYLHKLIRCYVLRCYCV